MVAYDCDEGSFDASKGRNVCDGVSSASDVADALRGPDMDGGSGEEIPPSFYRIEQNRLLRRHLLGRLFAMLGIWVVVFCVLVYAINTLVVPQIAEEVADAVAPWRFVSAEDAGTADWDEFQTAAQNKRRGIVVSYLESLCESESEGASRRRAEVSAEARAIVDEVSAKYPLQDDSSDEYLSYIYSETHAAIEAEVDRLAQEDGGVFGSLFAEAMSHYGATESGTVINGLGGFYENYYLDGHYEYRDMAVYDVVKSFKVPLALAVFMLGVVVIVWSVLRRSLSAFDMLFGAMESVLLKRDSGADLPRELEPTSCALEAIRRENDVNEMVARAAEQRKNELVAYLAHDIRTPLTSVVGYLTMLQESPDMPMDQRARYAGIALDRAQRLEGMLEEFFEITRYNLQSIPIERESFDAGILCRQVADEFFPSAEARGIEIEVEAQTPLRVFADAGKVSRVLNNLLKNAVAYADEGSTVRVRAKVEGRHGANEGMGVRTLVVEVENEGREISPAHLQSIFEKFYREDSSRGTQGGGAGLGLAIAREIAHAHGGELTAQSLSGRTVFTLAIPA